MSDEPEPDDLDRRVDRARKKMDDGRADLLAAIRDALEIKRSPSRIGRHAKWSRDYIAKIRDGKAQ